MPHHLLHDVLPNPHHIMGGYIDDGADSAIGGFGLRKDACIKRGHLGEQMLHPGLVIGVFDPRSQPLVLRDVTRQSSVREGSLGPSWRWYEKKSFLGTPRQSTNTESSTKCQASEKVEGLWQRRDATLDQQISLCPVDEGVWAASKW